MIAEPETQSEPVPQLTRTSAYQAVSLHLSPSRVQGSLGTTGRDVSLCAKGRRGRMERFKNFSLPPLLKDKVRNNPFLISFSTSPARIAFLFWFPSQGISAVLSSAWSRAEPCLHVLPIYTLWRAPFLPLQKLSSLPEKQPHWHKGREADMKQCSVLKPYPHPDNWE